MTLHYVCALRMIIQNEIKQKNCNNICLQDNVIIEGYQNEVLTTF